jgi:hypothetical protein
LTKEVDGFGGFHMNRNRIINGKAETNINGKRLPQGLFVLSERYPTYGVIKALTNFPKKMVVPNKATGTNGGPLGGT